MDDYEQNHERFLHHLEQSDSAVWFAAKILSRAGNTITIKPTKKAKKRRDWKKNIDNGDLLIQLPGSDKLERVEVKKLGVNFSGPGTWPFRDKFIVCAKHSWDALSQKPLIYMIISNDLSCIAVVKGATSGEWRTAERSDSRYVDIKQQFYFCPIKLVVWRPIGADLEISESNGGDSIEPKNKTVELIPVKGVQAKLFEDWK